MYVGIGHDAHTSYYFDSLKKLFPHIFGIKKLNKLIYGFCFLAVWAINVIKNVHSYLLKSKLTIDGVDIPVR